MFTQLKFQHTAARRRLQRHENRPKSQKSFQHTAARRRLHKANLTSEPAVTFQHTAARRRLHGVLTQFGKYLSVSTHSRTKAAANNTHSFTVQY